MSKRLRKLSGLDVVKILFKHGFVLKSRAGSHVTLVHKEDPTKNTTVPQHPRIGIGLMKEILRQVKMSEEDFFDYKKKKNKNRLIRLTK